MIDVPRLTQRLLSRPVRRVRLPLPLPPGRRPLTQASGWRPRTQLLVQSAPKLLRVLRPNLQKQQSQTFRNKPSCPRTMASDADYAAFLEKANADPAAGTTSSQTEPTSSSSPGFITTTVRSPATTMPASLEAAARAEHIFASDADELFEPVVLVLEGDEVANVARGGTEQGLNALSEDQFKSLILPPSTKSASSVSITREPLSSFDPHDRYAPVIAAVRTASLPQSPEPAIFRVGMDGVRAEYWVVGLGEVEAQVGLDVGGEGQKVENKKAMVGLKARAVES